MIYLWFLYLAKSGMSHHYLISPEFRLNHQAGLLVGAIFGWAPWISTLLFNLARACVFLCPPWAGIHTHEVGLGQIHTFLRFGSNYSLSWVVKDVARGVVCDPSYRTKSWRSKLWGFSSMIRVVFELFNLDLWIQVLVCLRPRIYNRHRQRNLGMLLPPESQCYIDFEVLQPNLGRALPLACLLDYFQNLVS